MVRNKPRKPDSQYIDIHTGKDLRLPRQPWMPPPMLPLWDKLLRRSGALPAAKPVSGKKKGGGAVMDNPYLERVVARMQADGARERLPKHWAFRCERCIHRVGYKLECAGWETLSCFWVRVTDPLVVWLGRMQTRYIVRKYF